MKAMEGFWSAVAAISTLSLGSGAAVAGDPASDRESQGLHGQRYTYGIPECRGDSPVVGRSDCKQFARWALPPGLPRLQMSLGGSVRVLGAHEIELDETAPSGIAFASSSPEEALGQANGEALTFDWRITGELTRFLYTGIDVSVGSVRIEDPAQERQLGLSLGEDRGMYYSAGAVAGLVLLPGPLVLRGEILGGARLIEVPIEYEGSDMRSRASVAQAVVEPRVAAELWLTPWVSAGARAGSDLLRERDYMFGLYVNLYGRAFNDSRGR